MAGSVVAMRNGLTKGIVAGDLTSGVYLVSVNGEAVSKSYKIII